MTKFLCGNIDAFAALPANSIANSLWQMAEMLKTPLAMRIMQTYGT